MVNDSIQCIKTNCSEANIGMAVLVRTHWIFRVIYMDHLQAIQANHPIELSQHSVKIILHIVACIIGMTSIKRHRKFLVQRDPINNVCELFKRFS